MKRVAFLTASVAVLILCSVGLAAPVASAQPAIAANEVRLCEHPDYLGNCYSFFLEPGMRQRLAPKLPAVLDDEVSSICVGNEVVAVLFTHPDFLGQWRAFSTNESDLKDVIRSFKGMISESSGKHWNDWTSSLIVTRRAESDSNSNFTSELMGVGLWQIPPWVSGSGSEYFDGLNGWIAGQSGERVSAFYPLPEDPKETEARFESLGGYMNDLARVAILYSNVEIELYEHSDFKGKTLDLPGVSGKNRFELDCCQMEGMVSSLIVRYTGGKAEAKGESPPLLPPKRDGEAAGESHRAPAAPMKAVIAGPITVPQAASLTLEPNTDRPGHNYRDFDLRDARPELCRDACAADPRCLAFTYVKPGIQGDSPRCWLKDEGARATNAPCCVSGIKQ